MKKSIICLIMIVITLFTCLSATAAQTAMECPELRVIGKFTADNSITVSWNKVDGASGYEIFLFAQDGTDYFQTGDKKTVSANGPYTCTFSAEAYNIDGDGNYMAEVRAINNNEPDTFRCDTFVVYKPAVFDENPMLKEGTDIWLMEDGIANWMAESTNGVSSYLVMLCKPSGQTVKQVVADAADTSVDFSSSMTKGQSYYAAIYVRSENDTVKSKLSKSETIVFDPDFYQPVALTCNITSFLSNTDKITLQLINPEFKDQDGNPDDVTTAYAYSNNAVYRFPEVYKANYNLKISKKNHVERTYSASVKKEMTMNVKIHPLGDINGDGKCNAKDLAMANAHVQKVSTLSGYELSCGDVVKSDGKILAADVARINSHIQKVSALW